MNDRYQRVVFVILVILLLALFIVLNLIKEAGAGLTFWEAELTLAAEPWPTDTPT